MPKFLRIYSLIALLIGPKIPQHAGTFVPERYVSYLHKV